MAKPVLKVTKLFFDSMAVINSVDKATRRVLSRFGAFVRRTAKSSIRKRKKISLPGEPPSSHSGLLKKFIFFSFDPRAESVVIGPEKLNIKVGTAPRLLEEGGATKIRRRGKIKQAKYKARPFMGPAKDKELPKLPAMWAGSVKP